VIKFRQGFGRLIRSRDDRGAVLILDRRVTNKGLREDIPAVAAEYGAGRGNSDEVFKKMEAFFDGM